MFQIDKKQIIKKHGNAVFFCCVLSVGAIRPPTQRTFREKSFGISKAFQNKVVYFEQSSFAHLSPKERCVRIFKGLFQKLLEARFGTQFQLLTTNKKARQCRAFLYALNVGASPQTLTQRTFREKSFGISKASPKQSSAFDGKFFCLPFLSRKVGREKFLGTSKALPKQSGAFGWKFFYLPFL